MKKKTRFMALLLAGIMLLGTVMTILLVIFGQ